MKKRYWYDISNDWILKIFVYNDNKSNNISWKGINLNIRTKYSNLKINWDTEIKEVFNKWDEKISFAELLTKHLKDKYKIDISFEEEDLSSLFDNNQNPMNESELNELIKKIEFYNNNYLELKDTEENALQDVRLERLKEISPNHPLLSYVASDLNNKREKIKHKNRMLSLEKITNDELKVYKWGQKFKSDLIMAQPKLDWHSLSLTYKNWKLAFAATRWNWTEWNIVTDHVAYINNVPQNIPDLSEIEIRWEVVIKNSDFVSLKDKFENPRNWISLSMKDPSETAERKLSFLWYNIFVNWNRYHYDESDKIKRVRELWFETFKDNEIFIFDKKDLSKFKEIIAEYDTYRGDNSPFDINIDWIVFKVNSWEEQADLWENDHDPNWAVAYKYLPEETTTELVWIDWDVSKDWNIIPVWMLKPVFLSWTTVSRVTLNNYKNVSENNIMIWDNLVVRKSWEIIPFLVKNISSEKRNKIILSKDYYLKDWCPSCWNKNLILEGVHIKCDNKTCFWQKVKSFNHFVKTLKIDFLGEWILERLVESKLINEFEDLYDLKFDDLVKLDWFQEWLSNKILKSINDSKKEIKIEVLLKAIWMDSLGERNAKRLLGVYGSLKNLIENINPLEIKQIDWIWDINSVYYTNIIKENKEKIESLFSKLWLLEKEIISDKKSENLTWKIFCLTGSMSKNREEIEKEIEAHWWKIGWVNKKLNYLVCWTGWWSKRDKVDELNSQWNSIQIITEEDLFVLMWL